MSPEPPSEQHPPASSPDRPRRASGRFLRLLEAACWIVGIGCLAWVGWVQLDAALYQRSQLASLEQRIATFSSEHPTAEMEDLLPSDIRPRELPPVEEGTALATLEIPRIDLSAVVASGTTETVLRRAVGHLPESARPGTSGGNVALAAHRDSFFRSLVDVGAGDEMVLRGPGFEDRYRVEWTKIVRPEDVEVVAPTDYPAMTLVTCYPPWWTGPAPERLIVRARRLDGEQLVSHDAAPGSTGVATGLPGG